MVKPSAEDFCAVSPVTVVVGAVGAVDDMSYILM
jgi:hypothetical protein